MLKERKFTLKFNNREFNLFEHEIRDYLSGKYNNREFVFFACLTQQEAAEAIDLIMNNYSHEMI